MRCIAATTSANRKARPFLDLSLTLDTKLPRVFNVASIMVGALSGSAFCHCAW
ncbi:hypothetical protein [Thiolapillus sp.]|uniref:hypothetical protein n=1 Tax=Thiolapillus sp. TaxID=2017437 RepID=UPI003AF56899